VAAGLPTMIRADAAPRSRIDALAWSNWTVSPVPRTALAVPDRVSRSSLVDGDDCVSSKVVNVHWGNLSPGTFAADVQYSAPVWSVRQSQGNVNRSPAPLSIVRG